MDHCVLVLCGKSPKEKLLASSLKSKKALKLMDRETGDDIDTKVLVDGDMEVESFGVGSYMDALATQYFGRFLIWTPKITSTHDLLHQNFGDLPVGSACLADVQSKGRGRVSNVWESPAGCLMYSFTVQMHNGRILPLLQYVVSLAVTEAVKHVCKEKGFPHLDVKIKWPNDIYLNGLKIAGISCNSKYISGIFNVSSGVGLNLDNVEPTTCLNAVLRKLISTQHKIKREEFLSAFFNKFEDYFETFLRQGFVVLEDLYYQTWLHSGQIVTIEEKLEGQSLAIGTFERRHCVALSL